jgi:hypothetical protein
MAEYQFPGRPETLDRKVIITWPQPMAGTVRPWGVTITDADTGELISTVSKAVLEVHLDAADALTWAAVKAFAAEGVRIRGRRDARRSTRNARRRGHRARLRASRRPADRQRGRRP